MRDIIVPRSFKNGLQTAVDALDQWISDETSLAKIYLATVVSVTAGLVTLTRHADSIQDDEEYPQIRNFDLEVGDLVAVTKIGEDTIVLGKLIYAAQTYLPISSDLRFNSGKGTQYYGTAPTAAVGAGAGTGATVAVIGSDSCGRITLVTGTGTAAGILLTLTFNADRGTSDYVISLTSADSDSASIQYYTDYLDRTSTSFIIRSNTIPTVSRSHIWFYTISEYNP